MLFNSLIFVFAFLPAALLATYGLGRLNQKAAKVALALLSLGFYAWWRPRDLPLLLASIAFNYLVGGAIQRAYAARRARAAGLWVTIGVTANLALLGWFKYANFVADNLNLALNTHLGLRPIALPLAISFYTFVNIAFLIDTARGRAGRIGLIDFAVFSTFFPKLLSGPLVHFEEFVPQIRKKLFGRLIWRNVLVGMVIFAIGLFKKTVIADTLAIYANPLFEAGARGAGFTVVSGWLAAITYTFQLYFDFSGYSDMAIGLGRMFGVKLPLNFHSPLRAPSIIDYWRRWHMTLQRLIVSYVFDPLALPLNRFAATFGLEGWSAFMVCVGVPIFATFVAVGVWHGAGWTFVVFGLMHGLYVCVNEAWRQSREEHRRRLKRKGVTLGEPGWARLGLYHALTLVGVAYANVMFRATTVGGAVPVWAGMSGLGTAAPGSFVPGPGLVVAIAASAAVVFLLPNTQQIMGRFDPAWNWRDWRSVGPAPLRWTWKPTLAGLVFAGVTLFLGVMFIQRGQAVFLYFKF